MSHVRECPLSGRQVVIAEGRAERPIEFAAAREQVCRSGRCPFCPGNEGDTPPPIAEYPGNGAGAAPTTAATSRAATWQVRVVPNKFPAVQRDAVERESGDELFRSYPGWGIHEVIVESNRHIASLGDLHRDELFHVFRSYRDRLRTFARDDQVAYVQVFKNVGSAAGASLEHVHSQLIALPRVPRRVEQERETMRRYGAEFGRCLVCAMIDQERAAAERVVEDGPRAIAFCPFASRFPYEVWIAPTAHRDRFEQTEDETLMATAMTVGRTIQRLERQLDRPAYNMILHTSPFDTTSDDHYHWHIEIFPRLTRAAGFEWATDSFINPVSPETAAARLASAGGGIPEDIMSGKTS